MAVALAHAALGEVPIARLALVALPSIRIRHALALAGDQVTVVVLRPDAVAVAGLAALRAEAIGARSALITLPAHHIGLALAVAAVGVADLTQRAGGIAVAHAGAVMDIGAQVLVQILAPRIRLVAHVVQGDVAIVLLILAPAQIGQRGAREDGRDLDAGDQCQRIHQNRGRRRVLVVSLPLEVNAELVDLAGLQADIIQGHHLTIAIRQGEWYASLRGSGRR